MGYSRARAVVTAHSCARRHGTPCVQYTQTHLGSLKRSRAHTRSRRAWRRDLRAARRTRVSICVERSLRSARSHRPKHCHASPQMQCRSDTDTVRRPSRAVKKAARVRRRVAHALGRSEAARTPRGRKGRARVTLDDPAAGRGAGGGAPAAVRHARLERLAHLPEGEACARGVSARRAHHPVRHNAIRTSRGQRQGRRTIAAERRQAGEGPRKRACARAGLAAILAPAAARARGSQTGEHAAPLAAGHAGPPHAVGRRRAHLPRDMRAACPTRARGGRRARPPPAVASPSSGWDELR